MKKMYKKPQVETVEVNTVDLMAPGGGSPIDGSMDPQLAPTRRREPDATF